jgi:hypothetical protein
MDTLSLFGLFAFPDVDLLRARFVLGFAAACALGSAYGFLQGAWSFGLVEGVWAAVGANR